MILKITLSFLFKPKPSPGLSFPVVSKHSLFTKVPMEKIYGDEAIPPKNIYYSPKPVFPKQIMSSRGVSSKCFALNT